MTGDMKFYFYNNGFLSTPGLVKHPERTSWRLRGTTETASRRIRFCLLLRKTPPATNSWSEGSNLSRPFQNRRLGKFLEKNSSPNIRRPSIDSLPRSMLDFHKENILFKENDPLLFFFAILYYSESLELCSFSVLKIISGVVVLLPETLPSCFLASIPSATWSSVVL